MIINQNNKNNVLKGKVNRGFNQSPQDLKEKLYNQIKNVKKNEPIKKESTMPNNFPEKPSALKVKETFKKLQNLK